MHNSSTDWYWAVFIGRTKRHTSPHHIQYLWNAKRYLFTHLLRFQSKPKNVSRKIFSPIKCFAVSANAYPKLIRQNFRPQFRPMPNTQTRRNTMTSRNLKFLFFAHKPFPTKTSEFRITIMYARNFHKRRLISQNVIASSDSNWKQNRRTDDGTE